MGELTSGARRLPMGDLQQRAARAAAGLASLGVGRGDLVALYLRNDFPFFEASFAAGLIGAYPTPVNWHYTADEARYLFENSGAKAIVIHADLIEGIREALPPGVPVLAVATPAEIAEAYGVEAAPVPPGMTDWSAWLEGFPPAEATTTEAPGTVIYTSGTTGHPKGVRRAPPTPEEAMVTMTIVGRAFGFIGHGDPQDIVTVMTGPMYHSAPNAYGLAAARLGAKVILQPRFDPEELLQLIAREKVTHLHMVPIMFHRLLKLPDEVKAKYDLSSLRFVVHAAAPCPPPIKRAMIEWWGPVINEYYGSTETSAVVFCTSEDWLAHPGTVGKAWPEADVRVIDAEGNSLPPGEVGEVVARIRGMADFTYHGDDAKRRASERVGLIAPGDIGYFDKDGFLYLCDRAKDMIISGGVNIYPAEIEAELLKMPGVADCAVFGIPDEEFGEAVCAIVQPQPGVEMDEAAVKAYLRAHVAGYKVPKRVELAAELPREDSGKIFKRKLREPYWAGLERQI
ncbi:acyl-CoA synthetase (AMP-forming)/AMP-acid ligase I [Phenylobacterium zucineum HLK1]|uniref:3-methylmercaptopropionyl-CoA ligase n=2 Tax=Phenylobacterium zucineum TaxID=284016 RepID=B4RFR6_PHEZH|nr:acyl-CoA synthetase (AMP-forming)/AMP-acid ligase I [Phenylobacterium zucineum HLK1]